MKTTTKLPATINTGKKAVNVKIVAKGIEKKAQPLIRKLKAFKIKKSEDYSKAFELTKELKNYGKIAKAELEGITDPIREIKTKADQSIKAANGFFKPFFDAIAEIDEKIKIDMLNFQNKLKGKRKELEQKFEDGEITNASKFMKASGKLEVSEGVAKVWTAVEKDRNKTPDKYWIVDETAVEADLKAGKKIPGWSWEQIDTIRI